MPLFVIGKSAKQRAFKNLNMTTLQVFYRSQKLAWMDTYLFRKWFICALVAKVKRHLCALKLPAKALLVLDNAPTHEEDLRCDGERHIKLMFLSPNVTSLHQPMDQGIIEYFKRKCCRKLLSEFLVKLEQDENIEALKSVNMKNVIYMLAKAYDEIPSSTVIKFWKKCGVTFQTLIQQLTLTFLTLNLSSSIK